MKYSNSNDINKYIDSIRLATNYKLLELSNEELVAKFQNARNGDSYLQALISKNTGAVLQIAKKYQGINESMALLDLIDVGIVGLTEAAKKYNPLKENKSLFITFAVNIIQQTIHHAVNGHSKAQQEDQKAFREAKRLDVPISDDAEDSDDTLLDTIASNYGNTQENWIEAEFMRQIHKELSETMKSELSLKARQVIQYLYGFDAPEMNVKEIAELFGNTTNNINAIHNAALRKLRNSDWWADRGRAYCKELKGVLFIEKKPETLAGVEYYADRNTNNDARDKEFLDNYFSNLEEE